LVYSGKNSRVRSSNRLIENLSMYTVSTMGSGQLGREIDLNSVIEGLINEFGIEENWHSDSIITIRLDYEGPALTLYRTGSYQIRGTNSSESLFDANERLLDALKTIGVDITDPSFEQKNTVFLEDFGTSIDLESLAIQLGLENVEYEPEQFPGLIYRPVDIETVNLIFASGKTIISGTVCNNIAEKSSKHLEDLLLI